MSQVDVDCDKVLALSRPGPGLARAGLVSGQTGELISAVQGTTLDCTVNCSKLY